MNNVFAILLLCTLASTSSVSDDVTSVPADVTVVPADVTEEALADEEPQPSIFDKLGQGFQKEIQTVRQPIDEAIINMGSMTCSHVQKLLGISYEQMQGEKKPDLNKLALLYRTRYFTTLMNLTAAPEALKQVRQIHKEDRLILFLHGFNDNPSKEVFINLTRSFFQREHVSLLALDASSMLRWLYLHSSTYVRFIGLKLGEVLAATLQHGQDPSLIHIIGYSLGSHIAGFAGKSFLSLTGQRIGRISALDPAGPCFSHVDPDTRLSRNDASYVDVLHTDAGVFGLKDPVGHKDYYPNSGSMQPGCMMQACSHTRSWLLYGESVVYPHAFPAVRCEDWDAFKSGRCGPDMSYMGYSSAPDGTNGLYFLQTGSAYPYGRGFDGITYRNADGFVQSIGNFFG